MSVNGNPHSSLVGPVPKKRGVKRRARRVAAKTELNPPTPRMPNKVQNKPAAHQSAATPAERKEAKEAARSAKKVLSKSKVFFQK